MRLTQAPPQQVPATAPNAQARPSDAPWQEGAAQRLSVGGATVPSGQPPSATRPSHRPLEHRPPPGHAVPQVPQFSGSATAQTPPQQMPPPSAPAKGSFCVASVQTLVAQSPATQPWFSPQPPSRVQVV